MPKLPSFNARKAENVSCWQCEHFQRYDENATPTHCYGDCRKDPPTEAWTDEVLGPSTEYGTLGFFTYIPFGNTNWCSGFQRSLEANIPPNPQPDSASACPETSLGTMELPYNFMNFITRIWSKKRQDQSCWYCAHWQGQFEYNPQTWPIVNPETCAGYCQIEPAWSSSRWIRDFGNNETVERVPHQTFILFGPLAWCSKWERNPNFVPPVPDFQNGLCNPLPPV